MRRINIVNELEAIQTELERREMQAATKPEKDAESAPVAPAREMKEADEPEEDFAGFPEIDTVADLMQPKPRRFTFFNLKNLALVAGIVAFGGYFVGQMSAEKPTFETATIEPTAPAPPVLADAFAPQSSAQLPPVQLPVSSASMHAQGPALAPIVKATAPAAPLKPVMAEPKTVKPSMVVTAKAVKHEPKADRKVEAALHVARATKAKPAVPKKFTHKKAVEKAPAAEPHTAQPMSIDDPLERLKQARELN